ATTSKIHTAVKIDPEYNNGPVIHVVDASRAVGVASRLLNPDQREPFAAAVEEEYASLRAKHAGRRAQKRMRSLEEARANGFQGDWNSYMPPVPTFTGIKVLEDIDLAQLRPYIDWTPFFSAWELTGKYPQIFEDPLIGESARQLCEDAGLMLDEIIRDDILQAKAVFGILPARREGDDIVLDLGDGETETLSFLRQQMEKPPGRPNYSLADFIAPADSGKEDYIGLFAVTAGLGLDAIVAGYEDDHDDYHAIMAKALADRLAEALAEYTHKRMREEFWAYAQPADLDNQALIREEYRGIRPAPGYPACPDHTEKEKLFRVLDAQEAAGISLTENFAMLPAASVSGYYFSHPQSTYFGIGRIDRDQLEEYAQRKGMDIQTAERWLALNLAYK
ncbi:MAG: vitamin B12 dependent-methionine synthase activation domain-containing protein, partial [Candidatus Promineifilaceae bacterium]